MILSLKSKLHAFFTIGSERSIAVKKNVLGSIFLKCVGILVSLLVVPMTINYVNPIQYGIWLTLSSIIAWISYFDFGFAHGFRNRFAESMAQNDIVLARSYVSTTYAILAILFFLIFILLVIVNNFTDWSQILNIDPMYKEELQYVFGLLSCFFCLNIVAKVFTTMLTASQKPALSSLIHTIGQVIALISIYILTLTTSGNLTILALAISGIPCFFLIVVSIIMFKTNEYKSIAPSFGTINFSLTKNILGLGGQFFIIMISMLFIFQFINIILSRVVGPEAVTQYNIASKYFGVLRMFAVIILNPLWSAFTDAYVKDDKNWMKSVVSKLEKMWLFCIPIILLMLLCSDFVYTIWIDNSVHIPLSLSICVALYFLCNIAGDVYMYLINGIGKVRLQLYVYLIFAVISVPLMNFLCRNYCYEAIFIVPIITFIIQSVIGRIQLLKIINGTAKGIWIK